MFSLTDEQRKKLSVWMVEQDAKVAVIQNRKHPYYGCSGGAYSYNFTPTSIGMCVSVTNGITKETIDLTDSENW